MLRHLAIIMDGNGRWAKARGLPRSAGHLAGMHAVRRVIEASVTCGIRTLTLYSFSSENWKRPPDEIAELMKLLRGYLESEVPELDRQGVRLKFIGDHTRLDDDIRAGMHEAETKTAANSRITLVLAISYGGQQELVRVCRQLIGENVPAGDIDEQAIASRLDTAGIDEPDMVLRTSGEQRLSNFLLWQTAYSELLFLDDLWPDIDETHIRTVVETYARRERRYGGL